MKKKNSSKKNAYGRDTFSFKIPRDAKKDNKGGIGKRERKAKIGQEESDEEQLTGQLAYSDVYVIGKSAKTNLTGTAKLSARQKTDIRQLEEDMHRSKTLGADDFIEFYEKARQITGNENENASPDEKSESLRVAKRRKEKTQTGEKPGRTDRSANVGSEPGERGKAVGLRVIGGRLRGTKLKYSGDHRVRPMKDRVRESVFNLMGTEANGRHVVDLFAGTGALTFEALSRGAEDATIIEVHFPTAKVTRYNIDILDQKIHGIKERIDLITTDVFFFARNLDNIKQRIPTNRPWLVFCSPPYDFYIDRQEEMLKLIQNFRECAPNDSLFVIEADERFNFELLGVDLPEKKRKSYPPAEIALFWTNCDTPK